MNQMYPPVPLPSSHMETPWMMEVKNAKANGEKAKIKPARANGNGFKRKDFEFASSYANPRGALEPDRAEPLLS